MLKLSALREARHLTVAVTRLLKHYIVLTGLSHII